MSTRKKNRKNQEEDDTPFVKSLQLRSVRGTKIKSLMEKKDGEEEEDDFWKNNKYFGSKKIFSPFSSASNRGSHERSRRIRGIHC